MERVDNQTAQGGELYATPPATRPILSRRIEAMNTSTQGDKTNQEDVVLLIGPLSSYDMIAGMC